jgi:Putative MetA-pathway of phenol degradation
MKIWINVLLGVAIITGGWSLQAYAASNAAEKTEQGPSAPERNWQIGLTPSYSSGNFGSNTTSSFVYAPLSIRRIFRDGDVSLSIPFVSVTSNGSVTLVGGQPNNVDDSGSCYRDGVLDPEEVARRPERCAGLPQFQGGGGTSVTSRSQTVTNSGLGDIVLKGRYYIVEERDYVPLIAVTARMKLPTASASKGLGTGEFDHGYGLEVSKMLGEKWIAFLSGGYTFIGNPDGFALRNQYWYDVGAGYYLTKALLVSVYFEEYRALVSANENIRDFFFAFNFKASDAWRFNGGVTVGVSNGAPDHAFSFGTSYRF